VKGQDERALEGVFGYPTPGSPDGYQKKGVAEKAKRIVVKTKGIGILDKRRSVD
jgi:hypothetical protein